MFTAHPRPSHWHGADMHILKLLTRSCAGLTVETERLGSSTDLRREAAFNLVRALTATGARALAMQVMRQHLTI